MRNTRASLIDMLCIPIVVVFSRTSSDKSHPLGGRNPFFKEPLLGVPGSRPP